MTSLEPHATLSSDLFSGDGETPPTAPSFDGETPPTVPSSIPPDYSTLVQSLLDELSRHEYAVRTALQSASRDQWYNRADFPQVETARVPYTQASNLFKPKDISFRGLHGDVNNGRGQDHRVSFESDAMSHGVTGETNNPAPNAMTQIPSITTDCTTPTVATQSAEPTLERKKKKNPTFELARNWFRPFSSKSQEGRNSDQEPALPQSMSFHIPSPNELQNVKSRSGDNWRFMSENTRKKSPRLFLLAFLQGSLCEYVVTMLILANAAMFGYAADYAVKNPGQDPPAIMRTIDVFFVIAFTLEIVLRMIAHGSNFFARSPTNHDLFWNVFDTLLVTLAVVEEIIMMLVEDPLDVSSTRMLRLLRLVRIVRVIRVIRSFKDLRIMIMGIVSSMKPFLWAMLLLLIIMYIFAVIFLQFVSDELEQADHSPAAEKVYFSNLGRAVYTLFMCISGGISWVEVAEPLIEINPVVIPFFTLYIAFSVFCVLNIVTGLFVERSTAMSMEDDETIVMAEVESRKKWMAEIENIFREADKDGSGDIGWQEFIDCVEDFRVQACMKKLGVDMQRIGPKQLWDTLDFDNSGSLEISEFVSGLHQVHGNARSIDICRVRHDQKMASQKISRLARMCESNFELLAEQVAANVVKLMQVRKLKDEAIRFPRKGLWV